MIAGIPYSERLVHRVQHCSCKKYIDGYADRNEISARDERGEYSRQPLHRGRHFREEERGKALSVMGMIPFIAPVVGPSVGGAISEALGWRWTFWLIAIIAGPLQIALFVTFRETYCVRILDIKAAKSRKTTGNPRLRPKYAKAGRTAQLPFKTMLRPLGLLIYSPVVLRVGNVSGIGMSLVYVIITSLPDVYEGVYGFDRSIVGLTYWDLGRSHNIVAAREILTTTRNRYDPQHSDSRSLCRLVPSPKNSPGHRSH